jgi:prepilin-type processing-associated H-X9-DG protein
VWGGDIRNAGSGSAAVAYADGHLYFRYQNGVMMLIEATPEGYREKGSFTIPGVGKPSWSHPVILDGRLYLREQDDLYVYDIRRAG